MKNRIISIVVSTILLSCIGVQAFATPLSDEEKQKIENSSQALSEAQAELQDMESKLTSLNAEIEMVMSEVATNEKKIEDTQKEIDNADEEIDKLKEEVLEKEKLLGGRLNAIYKAGGVGSYIDILLGADSISDFLSRVQALNKIVELDKNSIEEVNVKKDELDNRVEKLITDKEEIKKINDETKKKAEELDKSKKEMQVIADEYEEKVKSADVDLFESEKAMYDYWASVVNNGRSSISDLQTAIKTLEGIKSQVKSDKSKETIVGLISKAKSTIQSKTEKQTINRGDSGGSAPSFNAGTASGSASQLLSYAYKFLGKPYVWGATGPNAFDCSGFTSYVFRSVGVSLPRVTYDQARVGTAVSRSNLQPGDLIFTEISRRGPEHVGIYVGNGKMIHAANPRQGVIVGPMYNYGFARRVI